MIDFGENFENFQKQPGSFQDQSGSFREAPRRHFEGSKMPSGQFSVSLNFAILGPFPTIFRLSQNHWTFPNAALVFPSFPHVVRSTLLRIGLSDFARVGPKLAVPTLKRRVQNFDFGLKFHSPQWTVFKKTKFNQPHLYRSFDFYSPFSWRSPKPSAARSSFDNVWSVSYTHLTLPTIYSV